MKVRVASRGRAGLARWLVERPDARCRGSRLDRDDWSSVPFVTPTSIPPRSAPRTASSTRAVARDRVHPAGRARRSAVGSSRTCTGPCGTRTSASPRPAGAAGDGSGGVSWRASCRGCGQDQGRRLLVSPAPSVEEGERVGGAASRYSLPEPLLLKPSTVAQRFFTDASSSEGRAPWGRTPCDRFRGGQRSRCARRHLVGEVGRPPGATRTSTRAAGTSSGRASTARREGANKPRRTS